VDNKGIGCLVGTIVAVILFFVIFSTTAVVSSVVYDFTNHALSWTLVILAIAMFIWAIVAYENNDSSAGQFILATIFSIGWIIVLIFQGPVMYYDLYQHTRYEQAQSLVPQVSIRDVPYTVASRNFSETNPDSMSQPGDLDYVQGHWIASVDPSGWNVLTRGSQGFVVYDPDDEDPVVRITQEMPYAENGWYFNSSTHFVRSEEYLAQFDEILYLQDPNTKEVIAVISLIKRQGFSRWPYVANVMIVHSGGYIEMLSVDEAEADPRLVDVALKPEWMAMMEIKAYSYRSGVMESVFSRKGRIQIQKSTVNDENSAPFHLETVEGNKWFTPFSPLNSTGFVGVAFTSSHDIDGTVYIWQLSEGEGYGGADFMVSKIEGTSNHQNMAWYRTSSESECGNVTVLEMVPVVRAEPDGNRLYFLGYTSTAPNSVSVLFYTIIDPRTQVVYQDIYTAADLESWLRGERELQPQTADNLTLPSGVAACPETVTCTDITDLESQTDESLFELIRKVLTVIESR